MGLNVSVYKINPLKKESFTTNIIDGTDNFALDHDYFSELLNKNPFNEPTDNGLYHFLATGEEIIKLYSCQRKGFLKIREDDVFIVEWYV